MVGFSTIQHMVGLAQYVRRARVMHAQARLDIAMTDTRAQVPGLLYVPSQRLRLEASLRQRTRATQIDTRVASRGTSSCDMSNQSLCAVCRAEMHVCRDACAVLLLLLLRLLLPHNAQRAARRSRCRRIELGP